MKWKRDREALLCKKYGITLDQYKAMNEEQGGKCAICREPGYGRDLAVDHCHNSGMIRGLLCTRCNLGLGNFKESAGNLRRAVEYLNRRRPR